MYRTNLKYKRENNINELLIRMPVFKDQFYGKNMCSNNGTSKFSNLIKI